MSSDDCKERIVEHLQEYYIDVPASALTGKNWKRSSKRKNDNGLWERIFTNNKLPNARAVVGEDEDGELYVVSVTNCGRPVSGNATADAEDWEEINSTSTNMSDYYFAISDEGYIIITPKHCWEEEGCISDQHFPIETQLHNAGIYCLQESFFEWNPQWDADRARAALLNLGLIENYELLFDDAGTSYYDENGRWVGEAGSVMNAPVNTNPYLHAPSTSHQMQVFLNSTNGLTSAPAKPRTDATGSTNRAMDFED